MHKDTIVAVSDSDLSSSNTHKRGFVDDSSVKSFYGSPSRKKSRSIAGKKIVLAASVDLKHFEVPLFSAVDGGDGSGCESICLHADQPYTIGRRPRDCQFVFRDRRVSKQHCQIFFDGSLRKLYILGGVFLLNDSTRCLVHEFRNRVISCHANNTEVPEAEGVGFLAASNGVFVNGVKVRSGTAVELLVGDKVLLVCGNENSSCGIDNRIGFVIQRIGFEEGAIEECDDAAFESMQELATMSFSGHSQGLTSSGKRNKRVFAMKANGLYSESVMSNYKQVVGRANFLLGRCRDILLSDDPISRLNLGNTVRSLVDGEVQSKYIKPGLGHKLPLQVNSSGDGRMENTSIGVLQSTSAIYCGSKVMTLEENSDHHHHLCQKGNLGIAPESAIADENPNVMLLNSVVKDNLPSGGNKLKKHGGIFYSSPGKKFYLNRLEYANYGSPEDCYAISLPELLYPVESISRMFIATFTSDIKWFLSYCQIPIHLPLTIACHNTERCWSSRPDNRMSIPNPDYPNLVVVYPPFPESVAFSNNRKKQGIACHHPKLLVLQREDTIRVVITSANLVEKQWNSVTNTIWWQDFPRVSSADYGSLFPKPYNSGLHLDSKCDFAAQLAGFMASLLIDVPSQAHWIIELTKYDFGGATGHLVASVPGIHLHGTAVMSESLPSSHANQYSFGVKFLGSVVSSVVGISHLFHTAADSNGARLKTLAAFLGKSCKMAYGRLEIVLRRNPDVPADANAVSVLVPDPDRKLSGEYVQLGFMPRNVAQWISPLWDSGFFKFSGYVCPKEALAAALEENCKKVQLILYVSEGHLFQDIKKMQSEHIVALCSLVASIQRCYGLWRLQEVLNRYKWPESLESDFMYGSSSIGSVGPQFLAAFSAAAGKKSSLCFDSEESDPEWGHWNAREELKNPSIRILFPTIGRVKNAYNGILPSRRILCFSERTWQRLKTLDILHDAIPHPQDRIGHPMHVKVIRRRFWSGTDAPSIGWVYCGSHNFSAAAWGRQISNPFGTKTEGTRKGNPSLDSRLHICNYELGILFTFPREDYDSSKVNSTNLDDIVLPFVVPAPKYGSRDRPATMQAMREAMAERHSEPKQEDDVEEEIMEEITEGEEEMEATNYVAEEKEEEKAYAEVLWNHVESSQSC
ncbi:tyrosyl-DNA phosphodiesterase [Senna tora]|uniref:Tyrosyl-DNA phosphodiesterase n=1 Tax=Senna tora TaxID=362788 RepID=A0A834WWH9_9FABA|nr:tyrosyl-DNA phosphodiesterase [Senna tora]